MRTGAPKKAVDTVRVGDPERISGDRHPARLMQRRRSGARHEPERLDGAIGTDARDVAVGVTRGGRTRAEVGDEVHVLIGIVLHGFGALEAGHRGHPVRRIHRRDSRLRCHRRWRHHA